MLGVLETMDDEMSRHDQVADRASTVTQAATWASCLCALLLIVAIGVASVLGRAIPYGFIDMAEFVGVIAFAFGTPILSIVGWRTARQARRYTVANLALLAIWAMVLAVTVFLHW
jgi:cation transport ATPase